MHVPVSQAILQEKVYNVRGKKPPSRIGDRTVPLGALVVAKSERELGAAHLSRGYLEMYTHHTAFSHNKDEYSP